jgi:taurine dioxygenase
VSLADEVDAELFDELNRALLEWKVMFFRNQDISGAQHAAFAAHWGPLEAHPFIKVHTVQPDDRPEVVRFEKGPKLGGYENVWHSDVSWRECPSLGSVLRAIEVPEVGGDTSWADMAAAYDGLRTKTKERIADFTAVHDWVTTFGAAMDEQTRAELRADFPAVEHPVVRTHPETGRKTLYVNRAFTEYLVDVPGDEGRALLEHLYLQASFPEYQCRWKWQPGDVAFWDNRATQHYAASDYFPQRRVMERITIIGDRPF